MRSCLSKEDCKVVEKRMKEKGHTLDDVLFDPLIQDRGEEL